MAKSSRSSTTESTTKRAKAPTTARKAGAGETRFLSAKKPASDGRALERQMRVAEFFQTAVKQAGLSLSELAHATGLKSELLKAYLAGTRAIAVDDIFVLTNALNLPPEDLLSLIHDIYGQGHG